ncbi:hypothetical protein DID75_00995 [Candidatus Marinamargulisbacteria bacterium SCGC AG-410-N11]|nr:hypothetical protein DID75_00995 [Candidatus Marinamargulisbacteria bacterium SCGC AG-410-N11]
MRYIIDAYNLIGQLPQLSLSTPNKEEQLIHFLTQLSRNSTDKFLIVFDGHQPDIDHQQTIQKGSLKIIYTDKCDSADDYIIRKIESTTSKHVTIVSSDRKIQYSAKRKKIPYISCLKFIKTYRRATIFKEPQKPTIKPNDPMINFWLKEFGQL